MEKRSPHLHRYGIVACNIALSSIPLKLPCSNKNQACSAANVRSKALREHASKLLCFRKHCSSMLRSHSLLESTVRACSTATVSAKTMFEHVLELSCFHNQCSSMLRSHSSFEIAVGACCEDKVLRRQCPSMFGSHCAHENNIQACFEAIVPSKALSKHAPKTQ